MKFILSSNTFATKAKAIQRLLGWANSGELKDKCRVYQVEIKKVYRPQVRKSVVLEEEK